RRDGRGPACGSPPERLRTVGIATPTAGTLVIPAVRLAQQYAPATAPGGSGGSASWGKLQAALPSATQRVGQGKTARADSRPTGENTSHSRQTVACGQEAAQTVAVSFLGRNLRRRPLYRGKRCALQTSRASDRRSSRPRCWSHSQPPLRPERKPKRARRHNR